MFVPQLAHNILSVDALDEKGYSTLFANGIGKVFDRSSRKIILTVPRVLWHGKPYRVSGLLRVSWYTSILFLLHV